MGVSADAEGEEVDGDGDGDGDGEAAGGDTLGMEILMGEGNKQPPLC